MADQRNLFVLLRIRSSPRVRSLREVKKLLEFGIKFKGESSSGEDISGRGKGRRALSISQ